MGEEGRKTGGIKMGRGEWFVRGRGYQPDRQSGAYCLVYARGGEKVGGGGMSGFPVKHSRIKEKGAGGRQLVVKHRGNTREIGSGESYLLINKLN